MKLKESKKYVLEITEDEKDALYNELDGVFNSLANAAEETIESDFLYTKLQILKHYKNLNQLLNVLDENPWFG